KFLRERRQDARSRLEQEDARAGRIDLAEIAHQHRPADVGDGASQLHSGGSASHDHEAKEPALCRRILLVLRRFERGEEPPPDLRRLLQRLQTRGELLPFRMPEIAVLGAAGQHEEIPAELGPVLQRDALAAEIDAGDAPEAHLGVGGARELGADRDRDVRRVQARRRDLVEQRLEEMMIALIDDRDADAEVPPLAHAACDALYVIEARDALAIRAFEGRSSAPRREVLVLGAVDADEAVELARAQVDLALTDSGQARFVPALRAAGVRLRGHVHVDTGLGREGFSVDELLPALSWMGQARDAI